VAAEKFRSQSLNQVVDHVGRSKRRRTQGNQRRSSLDDPLCLAYLLARTMNKPIMKNSIATLGILTVAAFLAGPGASAGDWPQWRGPNRDDRSTETGLLKSWPAGGPPLAWKATGIGGGFSGVSVADGKVFTMGDAAESSYVRALAEKDGEILWSAKVGAPGGGDGHPGPRCTPTVDGNLVFALGQQGDLVCLQVADGKEVWRKSMKTHFDGKMMSGWGYSESLLADGDLLVCTPGGFRGTMVALNKKTGEVVWRSADWKDSASYSSVIIATIGGVKQYVQLTDASVAGIAPDSGRVLWTAGRKGRTAVVATPIVHDDHAYVTSAYGVGCNLFQITKTGDEFTAKEVYANKVMANHHGGVVLLDGRLYGYSDGKGWMCQDFKTGEEVWSSKALGKGSLTYADGCFYLRDEGGRGTIVLIEASPKEYKELSRFNQPDRSRENSWPHPVIANGKLYIRDQNVLLCYDIKAK
jgi:outer membrane protein assembly factor BamB